MDRKDTGSILARDIFVKGDKDGNKLLTEKEIKDTLKKIGIAIKDKELEKLISQFDHNKDGSFSFEEFDEFLKHLLRKEEIHNIFKKYAQHSITIGKKTQLMMTPRDLMRFFKEEQKQDLPFEAIQHLSEVLKDVVLDELCISLDVFNNILFSPANSIFNPDYLHEYQVRFLL